MTQSIFITLPVTDLARSRAFYLALGFTFDERFTSEATACAVVSETIYFMLGTHAQFQQISPKPLVLPTTGAMSLISLSLESRDQVDAMAKAAREAGGREVHDAEDLGFMYSRAFEDPDGNAFGIFWMNAEAS